MIDVISNDRMVVQGEALTGAYIVVPVAQLDAVKAALTDGGIKFWYAKRILVREGRPPATVVSLSRTSDTQLVQRLLDAA